MSLSSTPSDLYEVLFALLLVVVAVTVGGCGLLPRAELDLAMILSSRLRDRAWMANSQDGDSWGSQFDKRWDDCRSGKQNRRLMRVSNKRDEN